MHVGMAMGSTNSSLQLGKHSCTALAQPLLCGATSPSSALVLASLLTLILLPLDSGNNHLQLLAKARRHR
jgi:hypothetical protein